MNSKNNRFYKETNKFIIPVKNNGIINTINNFIRSILYPFYNAFYNSLLLIISKPKYNKKYDITICSIFKNEDPFLREWLIYHHMLGVEHFYLYNNNSEDNYLDTLTEFIDKGLVTLIQWPEIPGQISAYKNWYINFRNETQWVSFLDLDEYICPNYDTTISSWLKRNSKYPVIVIYWLMFGTSGRLKHNTDNPLIENYCHCWNKKVNVGKVFYNTNFEINSFNTSMHHFLQVKWKNITLPPFNNSGNIIKWIDIHKINKNNDSIQINHYYSRAYNILESKLKRGDSAYKTQWRTKEFLMEQEYNNKSTNYNIHRFLLLLKLEIKKWNK